MSFVLVDESHAGGVLAVAGVDDGAREFRRVGPTFRTAEDPDGHVSIEPCEQPCGDPPYIAKWADDIILRACPHYPKGQPCTDPEGIARRVADARASVAQGATHAKVRVPSRGMSPETDALIPLVDGLASEFLEFRSLPAGPAGGLLVEILGISQELAAERIGEATRRPFSYWPWDGRGKALDKAAEDAERARRLSEEKAAAEAAIDAMPNDKTIAELGYFVCRRKVNAPPNGSHRGRW